MSYVPNHNLKPKSPNFGLGMIIIFKQELVKVHGQISFPHSLVPHRQRPDWSGPRVWPSCRCTRTGGSPGSPPSPAATRRSSPLSPWSREWIFFQEKYNDPSISLSYFIAKYSSLPEGEHRGLGNWLGDSVIVMEAEEDIDLGVKPRAHALNQGL